MAEPKVTKRSIKDYRPAEINPNKGTVRGVPAIVDSLSYNGAGRSILVDKDGEAIAGSHTIQAAIDAGFTDVYEIETDGKTLIAVKRTDLDLTTDAKARALQIADNRTTILGYDQDDELVAQMLIDIAAEDSKLVQGAGFDEHEIKAIMDTLTPAGVDDPGAQIDRAEELQNKWHVERGQVWQVGQHRLMCGDSTSAEDVARLMDGEKVSLCFTSPPYNLGDSIGLRNGVFKGANQAYINNSDNDAKAWLSLMVDFTAVAVDIAEVSAINVQLLAGNKRDLVTWLNEYSDRLIDILIWNKSNPQPAMAENVASAAFEFIILLSSKVNPTKAISTSNFDRGQFANVYTSPVGNNSHTEGLHGATFPLDFAAHYIANLSVEHSVVYDPFAGSGTTMVVCEQLNRKCMLMEIEPKYCAVTLERLAGMGLEPRLIE